MKRIVVFLSLLLVSAAALAQTPQEAPVYFSAEELPDLIKCLPAPPAKGTPGFRYDEQRYQKPGYVDLILSFAQIRYFLF